MATELNIDPTFIGVIFTITSVASGLSSLRTYKIRQKLGSNLTSILGLVLYSISMVLYAKARNMTMLVIAPIILGLANGIIDVNSNSYVVKAYDAKWVSFMHAVWGLTATAAPMLMTFALLYTPSYRNGFYIALAIIVIVVIVLSLMKSYWIKKRTTIDKDILDIHSVTDEEKSSDIKTIEVLKKKRVLPMLLCFSFSIGSGCAFMAWVATMVVAQKGLTVVEGATTAAVYSFTLMIGRVTMGIAAEKIGTDKIIKALSFLETILILVMFIPYKNAMLVYANIALIGFMSGPLTPLLNADLKDLFDVKILSVLISLGGVFGLCGIAAISAVMTVASRVVSIHYVQIVPAIGFAMLFLLYSYASNKADKIQ
jgi:fucose permease